MITVIKSGTIGWSVHVAHLEEKRKNMVGNLKERDHLEHITINGIKVDLKEIGWGGSDWPRIGPGDRQFLKW